MIITPGQLTQRAEFYHQLHQLTAAGIGIVHALEQIKRAPPSSSYREPLGDVLKRLASGSTLSEALKQGRRWLPEFDLSLLEAGEQSGRLDACFKLLADYYTDRARIARQVITDLLYPAFLVHMLAVVSTIVMFFWVQNLVMVPFMCLGGIYLLVFSMIYAAQSKHGEAWRAWVESVLAPIPVLRAARRYLSLARLSASLEALITAGVTIIEAWMLAATASGSPALRRTVHSWQPLLQAGRTPAELVVASPIFPELFSNQYNTGEISGKIDETLRRLYNYYQEEGSRKLHAVARWVPILIYLGILITGGAFVIWFWLQYYGRLKEVMQPF